MGGRQFLRSPRSGRVGIAAGSKASVSLLSIASFQGTRFMGLEAA
jgi:hypothetical protein